MPHVCHPWQAWEVTIHKRLYGVMRSALVFYAV
jgi:hypothetical protein